jgi:hypothetical protein
VQNSIEKILRIASLVREKELPNRCLDNLESKEIEKKAFSWFTVRLLAKLHLQILYLRLFSHPLYSHLCIQKQLQIIKGKA